MSHLTAGFDVTWKRILYVSAMYFYPLMKLLQMQVGHLCRYNKWTLMYPIYFWNNVMIILCTCHLPPT